MKKFDIIIIGAGISGCTLAQHYASIGKKVLIIEKRNHIAGNSYDYIDENGILVSKYGAQLFHTSEEDVWEYVTQFSEWFPCKHTVIAEDEGASLSERLLIRTNFDDRYFSDKYEALPTAGYTQMFERMLDHPYIDIMLNTDYFDIKSDISGFEKLFFTGTIDQYFETTDTAFFQENSVMDYPENDVDYSRIIEYNHFGEPHYPVPNPRNRNTYSKYKGPAETIENVYFVGKPANYRYLTMDKAFKNAIALFYTLEKMYIARNSYRLVLNDCY